MKKIRVAILFGGRSAEHEVSVMSAKNVFNALNKEKYEPVLVGIGRNGKWYLQSEVAPPLSSGEKSIVLQKNEIDQVVSRVDVVFPVLHGPYGEDGTIQGLLKLSSVPFVGAGVLGSAIGMDKDVAKRLLHEAGILTAKFLVFRKQNEQELKAVEKKLGFPCFVKPVNLGSSVGISRANNWTELEKAVSLAFQFDRKIIIEEAVVGREIEVSVLGNNEPIASLPGEVETNHEFYDYEAKYVDENNTKLFIPAKLDKKTVAKIQEIAIKTYRALECEGMARVDLFLQKDGKVLVNEINTIPGFTNYSMYPKLWEASGVSQKELLDRLIQLAIDRHQEELTLKTTY